MPDKMDYMGPLKNILLATDGSKHSEGAIKEAIYLAKSCVAKLSVIYVLEINPELETEGQKLVEKMENEAREHIDEIRKRAARENVECEVIARRTDQPFKAIVEEAEKRNIDVIVMGRRGRTGLKKALMGSVTAKVIGYAPCKVLIVPVDARIDCKNIMLATDGSKYSEAAAAEAISIAKRCGSNLMVVSVVSLEAKQHYETGFLTSRLKKALDEIRWKDSPEAAERNISAVMEMAKNEGVNAEGLALIGRHYEAIVDAAREHNTDIIVLGAHGKTGIERLLMGSVTERVIALSPCTVLVVKIR